MTPDLTQEVLAAADLIVTRERGVGEFVIPEGVLHVDRRVEALVTELVSAAETAD